MKTFLEVSLDYRARHDLLEADYFEPDGPGKRKLRENMDIDAFNAFHESNWKLFVKEADAIGVKIEADIQEADAFEVKIETE